MRKEVSIVIATLDRTDELDRALDSIARGTLPPRQVVIVDGSDDRSAEPVAQRWSAKIPDTRFVYESTPPGLPGQRNRGLELARGEIILFLDDDVILENEFLTELTRPFSDERVGGAMGVITNLSPMPRLTALLQRIFLLNRHGDRNYLQRSGFPQVIRRPDRPRRVQVLSGCNMAFRRAALAGYSFDPRLNYFDDMDASLTVAREWLLIQWPSARLRHLPSPRGRPRAQAVADRTILERRLLHRRHLPQTVTNVLAFYWSVAGQIIWSALHLHPRLCLGEILGLVAVLGGKDMGRW